MRKIVSTFVVAAAFGLSACAGQSDTTQRTVSGGAIGAAGGAVIGAIAGNAGLGLDRRRDGRRGWLHLRPAQKGRGGQLSKGCRGRKANEVNGWPAQQASH